MPSLGQAFGKRGVPPRDAALEALGLEKAKKGLEREREGAKGLDEIGLSAKEQIEAEKSERVWDRDGMIAWAKTIGNDSVYNEAWVDKTFKFLPDGKIRSTVPKLNLSDSSIETTPPGLEVQELLLVNSSIKEIPSNIVVNYLDLSGSSISHLPNGLSVNTLRLLNTELKELPHDLVANEVILSGTPIETIPSGLRVKILYLNGTNVTDLPEDMGEIEMINISSSQTELAEIAKRRSIKVVGWK